MADNTFERDEQEAGHEGGGSGFMMGLLTGTVLGAGLGMLLAPKSGSELRNQISEQASSFGRAASGQWRRAADAASGAVDRAREATQRGADEGRERAGASEAAAPATNTSTYTGAVAPDLDRG